MKEHPYFSVIITVYNIENYICDCIESVKDQSFTDYECIIVDDGSADRSPEAIRSSVGVDSRFRLVTIPHGGPQKAKNAGLEEAGGEYVIFVDGDDTLAPMCLQDCREKTNGSDLLIFGINYQQYANGIPVSERAVSLPAMEFASGSELADWYIVNRRLLLYSNANKLYRRESLKNGDIRFRDELSFGEDRLFNFDFLRVCNRIRVLPGVYYNYRAINAGSLTHFFRRRHIDELLMLHEQKICCLCGLSEKTDRSEKERFIKDDYDYSFDLAFDMLRSGRDSITEEEYTEELAYLEARFLPLPQTAPYYFCLDHAWMSREKRASDFVQQIRTFKSSDAMHSLITILDEAAQKTDSIKRRSECGDDYAFLCQFGTRKGESQQSLNDPAAWRIEDLLRDRKEQLYHALYELGFIGNNKLFFDSYDYILILGGANDANRMRTIKAKEVADELIAKGRKPKVIAGLSTNRRLSEAEHRVTDKYASGIEYEFDIMSKCMENELFISSGIMTGQLVCMEHNDADPTFSSKIVEFTEGYKGCTVRSCCAPKRSPNVARAAAEDCLEFFLSNCEAPEGSNVLLITSNFCCGSSFKAELGIEYGINLDIVGNDPDGALIQPEKINCFQFINELIKMYGELNRFEAKTI